jgi:hypothetical protein
VKDVDNFRVASIVFWCALYAIQRGFSPADADKTSDSAWAAIWARVPKSYKQVLRENEVKDSWDYEGTSLLRDFESNFSKWVEDWTNSPAGVAFTALVEKKMCDIPLLILISNGYLGFRKPRHPVRLPSIWCRSPIDG